jgi:GDP-L-fucose synthase
MLWGDGTPLREFLHVDDLAKACDLLLQKYNDEIPINIGTGLEVSISELAKIVASVVSFEGEIKFDNTKPNGTPRKILQTSRILELGWEPTIRLQDGIKTTYAMYKQTLEDVEQK